MNAANSHVRKLHLNVFLQSTGHHDASWRHPAALPERTLDIRYYMSLAQTAERGLFDSLFIADTYAGKVNKLEPFTQLAALASVTERIGLIATAATTYNEPFHVARKFASLDHISGGRAGWNIVTGGSSAAHNFSREEHPEHDSRYETAAEFTEVVKRLWDSWEDDASRCDKDGGVLTDHAKVHAIDFHGSNYNVKGPLNIARPPQGYPVLVQSGSSDSGKELAAATGEVVFTAQQSLHGAVQFYEDVKRRLARYGRQPEQLHIMPGLCPVVADTDAEALELEQELNRLVDTADVLRRLSSRFTVCLNDYPLDGPVPLDKAIPPAEFNGLRSRQELIIDMIRRDGLTIRELVHRIVGGHGHITFTGTAVRLADLMEQWFRSGAADGFNLMPQLFPGGLDAFVDKVVPELQNRGLFRTGYEGKTLRENLGLARPQNQFHSYANMK
jgi:FMN-dependent oxidoreductase (nitrilotriacetate monooxygenase family)